MQKIKHFIITLTGFAILSGCNKIGFLHEPPSEEHIPITKLEDLQALLDNDLKLCVTPVLPELSADNYYLTESFWQTLSTKEKMAYVWAPEIYDQGQGDDDWFLPYQQVNYANVLLENLNEIAVTDSNRIWWNAIRGSAYFIRAYAFYNLAQVYALPYDKTKAGEQMGIPLKLTSDVDETIHRSTIKETYTRIIDDLKTAKRLLPAERDPSKLNRPSQTAADAMLARVYLCMQEYNNALVYADSCLLHYNTLMDYNILGILSPLPFSRLNAEVIYQTRIQAGTDVFKGFSAVECVVDSVLYASYVPDDLRKQAYYVLNSFGLPNTKGTYNGSLLLFTGLATDEVYITRAECLARLNDKDAAMRDINTVLEKRFRTGTFTPLIVPDAAQALQLILTERRKELAFRGIRWTDIRRLNTEGGGRDVLLTRKLAGVTYTLTPGHQRYALPIPPDEIAKSGIPQNPR